MPRIIEVLTAGQVIYYSIRPMKTLRLALLGLLFSAFVSLPAQAVGPSILAFQVNGIGVFPTAGGNNIYSGQAAWIPQFGAGAFGIRGELGAAWLKNGLDERFFAFNYEGFLVLSLTPITDIELGGGMATWAGGNGGTYPILSGYLVISIPGVINRLFVGYSRYFLTGNNMNEVKLGLGFSL